MNKKRISAVLDEEGRWVRGLGLKERFLGHFKAFLGSEHFVDLDSLDDNLFINCLDKRVAIDMIKVVTDDEIKAAMFEINENRAPGPDGFSSKFFKSGWSIVGPDVCKAVREVLWTGKLPRCVNATRIVLILKVDCPRLVTNYRSIACCNTLYKCISKVLVNRIRGCLDSIVDSNQSAFIP